MTRVTVCTADPSLADCARLLASELNLPLADPKADADDSAVLMLTVERDGLRLVSRHPSIPGCLTVDFLRGPAAYRRIALGSRRQPLARAIGIRGSAPSVFDATAGLARDAFQLACLGCRVTAVERSGVLFAMIRDALNRARKSDNDQLRSIIDRIHPVHADSRELLLSFSADEAPDVVYLDPMYVPRGKAALVKKELRICRMLVGDDDDAGELLDIARRVARARVVVKRHRKADPLLPGVSFRTVGRVVRYDVYLSNPAPNVHQA